MKMKWSDNNRFNQSGYSSPTEFPHPSNYDNLDLFMDDMVSAVEREKSHREWLEEERYEARIEAQVEEDEQRARNSEIDSGWY